MSSGICSGMLMFLESFESLGSIESFESFEFPKTFRYLPSLSNFSNLKVRTRQPRTTTVSVFVYLNFGAIYL